MNFASVELAEEAMGFMGGQAYIPRISQYFKMRNHKPNHKPVYTQLDDDKPI